VALRALSAVVTILLLVGGLSWASVADSAFAAPPYSAPAYGAPPSPAPPAGPPSIANAAGNVPTRFTRQTEFTLPFRIDPADPNARRAVEVQLHVAENGGNWKLGATAAPDQQGLHFKAHGDGDYAFMVRTRDDRGDLQPATPPAPELIVVVDTNPPVLELTGERGAAGEITARWRANDPHLANKTLRVEYQLGVTGAWLPVAIDNPKNTTTTASGEATWIVDVDARQINIQAQVADAAGNVAKTLQRIDLTVAGGAGADKEEWRSQNAPKPDTSGDMLTNWPGERTNETPLGGPPMMSGAFPSVDGPRHGAYDRQQYAGAKRRPRSVQPEVVTPRESIAQQETLPSPQPDTQLAQPGREQRLPIPGQPEEVGIPRGPNERRQPPPRTRPPQDDINEGPLLTQTADGVEPVRPGEQLPPGQPVPQESAPRGASRSRTASPSNDASEAENTSDRPRYVNSQRFELDYDVEEVGRAGVAKVEVWGTKDNGRHWTSYGVDNDNRSPIVVKVDGEGLYGFRVVIESGAGLRGDAPRSGDEPDVWIGVDTTKPVARLTTAEVGVGLQAGDMVVRWEAHDNRLSERPVTLSYSPKPSGPWTLIATGLDNSGRYVWRIDNRAPDKVYLRIEVRDEAGNVEKFDSPDAVSLDPVRPKGRIRAVRPLEDSSAQAPKPYRILR